MADISKITLPNGNTYDLKDNWARTQIEALAGGSVVYLGVTTTQLVDGVTTNPKVTINGEEKTAAAGGLVTVENSKKEFIYNGTVWQELGDMDLSGLGKMAKADTASGSFTPTGTITEPTTSIELNTTTINGMATAGELPVWTASVASETLTIGWSGGALPTSQGEQTVATSVKSATTTAPTFNGSQATITVTPNEKT